MDCPKCGNYQPSEIFLIQLNNIPSQETYLYSAAIREVNEKGNIPFISNSDSLLELVRIPKNPLESVDRILLYVSRKASENSGTVRLDVKDSVIGYAKDVIEFHYFLNLARELKYFQEIGDLYLCRITSKGWERVIELSKHQIDSDQAFVAMSYDPNLEEAWKSGLKPALIETGYSPIRMKDIEYNDKIDDRIVAEIRNSGLLVAEFTGQRAGVYFEAGLAMGIGIPVIWICKETDVENLHFDTRQYNYITWVSFDELKEKLIYRIKATLPNRKNRA
ncbi:MAG TPA: hypothetical protein VF571_05035 [Pyrinomonadaceae bacterium]|jgi:hypothetical protein